MSARSTAAAILVLMYRNHPLELNPFICPLRNFRAVLEMCRPSMEGPIAQCNSLLQSVGVQVGVMVPMHEVTRTILNQSTDS